MTEHILKISVFLVCLISVLCPFSILVKADDYEPSDYFASIGVANNPTWMSQLPNDRLLSDLSIPGTHDSMAVWGNLGSQPPTPIGLTADITKVQQRFNENGRDSLYRQFLSGIRTVDIRVVFTTSADKTDPIPVPQLAIHHGPIYQYANFYDTLSAASEFLTSNPSETILLRLKLESGSDEDSKEFPSVLQKYADNRPMGLVLYEPSVKGSIPVPKLGEVRGKMVLMNLIGKGGGTYGGFGINPDSIDTQDEYEFQLPNGAVKKFSYVREQLKKTADPANRDKIMINFVSATTKFGTFLPGAGVNGPAAIAHDTNQMVWSYLDKQYAGQPRTGILMFDYPGWKVIETIIDFNKKASRKVSGKKPNLGDQFTTFKVKAGSVSFDASIPAEAMATYVWEDNHEPVQWLTTAKDGGFGYKMERFVVTSEGSGSSTIEVDPGKQYQTIDGFGAALTDSAAHLIANSPKRNEIMQKLFGTGKGEAGLTIARIAMGSSDLMYDPNNLYTYEDQPGSFSIDKDGTTIDILKQAKSISGGNLKILGTPWSAPGWMKRGKSLLPKECGSDLNELDPKYYEAYANYFRKFVDAYSKAGVRPWMVSMGNEPENCKTDMPTTQLTSEDEIRLSRHLKRTIPTDVKVLGWDHNWNDPQYVDQLVSEGTVDAIGYHCYDGTNYKDQTQRVATYLTECSGFTDQSTNVPANQGWEVINTIVGPLRYGSKGSMYWSMAQRSDGSPSLAGNDACKTCRGMINVDGDNFQPSQDFYFWAHFSRFVRPGSVRIESSQSGDLSTVAFHQGGKNILFVINSASNKADGGSPGSDSQDMRRHIVQWDGDQSEQKSAWLVGIDGYRRWISDGSTFNCLKYDAGMKGPDAISSGSLDRYINIKDSWAVCGSGTLGTRSELEVGTYLKSDNGARLTLTDNGLKAVDSRGHSRWAPSGKGDRLILQEDQNLVLYDGRKVVWSSETEGSGAVWLSLRDDGSFALFNKADKKVWSSEIKSDDYRGKIVQWDNDRSEQKASWLVGADSKRRWIHDWETYKCLRDVGKEDSYSVSSDILDQLENLDNVWAACGGDRIGPYGALETNSYLKSGDCLLSLTNGNLQILRKGKRVWATGKGGAQLILQPDGNLVIYDNNRNPTWATYTDGKKPGWLVLGDDCSLRLYNRNNEKIWER